MKTSSVRKQERGFSELTAYLGISDLFRSIACSKEKVKMYISAKEYIERQMQFVGFKYEVCTQGCGLAVNKVSQNHGVQGSNTSRDKKAK